MIPPEILTVWPSSDSDDPPVPPPFSAQPASAMPATADVKTGVDAWARGDYAAAIAEWRSPAAAGDDQPQQRPR